VISCYFSETFRYLLRVRQRIRKDQIEAQQ